MLKQVSKIAKILFALTFFKKTPLQNKCLNSFVFQVKIAADVIGLIFSACVAVIIPRVAFLCHLIRLELENALDIYASFCASNCRRLTGVRRASSDLVTASCDCSSVADLTWLIAACSLDH